MNLLKKRIIIGFLDFLSKEDAKNMFVQIPHSFPNYFKSIPRVQYDKGLKKHLPFLRTIKTCAGFINLYKRSFLITSPFDIYVEFDKTGIIKQQTGTTSFNVAQVHDNEQLLNYVNNHNYKFILKLELPISIDSNVSLLLSDSSYHFNPMKILPGIIPSKYKNELNFFIPIEKHWDHIHINKGAPLFLLTPLCENTIKIEYKKYNKTYFNSLTFSRLKQYLLEKLI